MKNVTFILFLLSISLSGVSRTIDLNIKLREAYSNKDYSRCYEYCKVINNFTFNLNNHPQNLSRISLQPLVKKYKSRNTYICDSVNYYELASLKIIDIRKFYCLYFSRNIFRSKDSSYSGFVEYYEKLNKSTSTLKDYSLNLELNRLYHVLKDFDAVAFKKIFVYNNSELISISKKAKNILSYPSDDFYFGRRDISTNSRKFYNKETDVQTEMNNYFIKISGIYRFVNKDQILNFLFSDSSMNREGKLFVAYYFCKNYNDYDMKESSVDITDMLCKRKSRCSGYSVLFGELINQIGVDNYYIKISTNEYNHVFNTIVVNNEKYIVDITNNIYFKKLYSLPNSKKVKEYNFKHELVDYVIDYKTIKNHIISETRIDNMKY